MIEPNPDYKDAPYEAIGFKLIDGKIVRFRTKEISRDAGGIRVETRNIDTDELMETYAIPTMKFNPEDWHSGS
jgi:hypothetical protein